jgi:hypothetical protein
MAGTLTVTGLSAGEPAGEREIGPLTITGATVIGETFSAPLSSGDNTFAVPSGAVAALIVPPANSTVAVKVRTSLNASDAGLPINAGNLPMVYPFPATAPTSLIVNAASGTTGAFTIAFI